MPEGRELTNLCVEKWGEHAGKVVIHFCDYSGHRSKRNGCHYTASHSAHIDPEQLFELLASNGYMEHLPGNEPDLVECDGCGNTFFSDELEVADWDTDRWELLCPGCREEAR